jgi:CHAT domain-containing protein/tetratricopeptide (TPR) repeat protein
MNIGAIYKSQGDIDIALEYYQESLEMRQEINDKKGIASSSNNIASIYKDKGEIAKALQYYEQSLTLFKEVEYKRGISLLHNSIGHLYQEQGNYPKALEYMQESVLISRQYGDKMQEAAALINLGGLYVDLHEEKNEKETNNDSNHLTKAKESFTSALEIYQQLEDKLGESHALSSLGYLNQYYARNIAVSSTEKDSLLEVSISFYHQALDLRREINHKGKISEVLINISSYHLLEGDLENAEKFGIESYEIAKEIGFAKNKKASSHLMGQVSYLRAVETNHDGSIFKDADDYVLEFVELNNTALLNNFSVLSEKEQEDFFKTVTEDYMDFNSYVFARKELNPDLVGNVFDNTLRNKGLLLKSSIALRNSILESKDTSLIDNYYQWIFIKKQIAKKTAKGQKIEGLVEQANELEKELVRSSEVFADFENLGKVNWRKVQSSLNNNEAAIEFIHFKFKDYKEQAVSEFSDSVLYCALVVKKGSEYPEMIPLFYEHELEQLLGKFGGNNLAYVESLYGKKNEKSTKLYDLIWRPMESSLKESNKVFLSPSGLLHKVSFSGMATGKEVYLCDQYEIEMKTSIGKLIEQNEVYPEEISQTTVFGGVEYNTNQSTKEVWSYLEGTKSETERISSTLKKSKYHVNYFSGTEATEDNFKASVNSSTILHIATHGFFYADPELIDEAFEENSNENETSLEFRGGTGFAVNSFVMNPNPLMRSGLVFSGANDVWTSSSNNKREDGVLTAQEVSHLDLRNTFLVVMSACETGLGDIKGSEGVYGLQRAFKMAGSQFMIMSLWQVPDAETKEFMVNFYSLLIKKQNVKIAFQQTQEMMRKKYGPYFWAAFVLID